MIHSYLLQILLCALFPFLIYPLIYFVVDEHEDTDEYTPSQEDMKVNKNGNVTSIEDKEPVSNDFRTLNDSLEMTIRNEREQFQESPKTTASHHKLLSEGMSYS